MALDDNYRFSHGGAAQLPVASEADGQGCVGRLSHGGLGGVSECLVAAGATPADLIILSIIDA